MAKEGDGSFHRPDMGEPKLSAEGLYEYKALPSKTHIRLLIISPGTGDDALQGSIGMVDLETLALDLFEAISYTWGPGRRDQSILIDGKSLQITKSMREALLQTRLPDRCRTLWADSICINQDDIIEKSQQVSLMGRIYKASRRTLICLRLEPHNKQKARDVVALMNEVEIMINTVMRDPAFKYEYDSFPWPSENDPLVVDSRWLSAWEFLVCHPWF